MSNNKERTIINFEHGMVHDGDAYEYHFTDATMADTETINIAFKTPAVTTKQIHILVEFGFKVAGHMEIIEAATWTAKSGTAVTPINANRNSENVSTLLGNETTTTFTTANELALNVTTVLTTVATTIETRYTFDAKKSDAAPRGLFEWILKAGTTYVIRLTADGGSNAAWVRMRWYEYLPNVV